MRRWPALDITPIDDLVQAALTDHDVAAIDEDASRVFFHSAGTRDRAAVLLRQQFPALQIAPVDVDDEDWAARSQAELKSVRVGNIVVSPPWDVRGVPALTFPGAAAGESHAGHDFGSRDTEPIVIVIQPSMGFGTGHHATTRLCLAHLQQNSVRGRTALDVGTGSGVLAIAASRLGAAQVLAIDDDPDAIAAARENLDSNPGVNVTLGTLDLRRVTLRPFDLVIANLTGALLAAASSVLVGFAAPGGRLILSGFMAAEEGEVTAAFSSCSIETRSQEDEWVCATLLRSR